MTKTSKIKPADEQREKFIQKAKELGVTTEAAFNAALKRIGKASVPAMKTAKKKAK